MVRISEFLLKLKISQVNLIDKLKHTKNLTQLITHNYSADFIGFVLNLKREYLVFSDQKIQHFDPNNYK